MSILSIILISFGLLSLYLIINPPKKKNNKVDKPTVTQTSPTEQNPVEVTIIDDQTDGEMPIKPIPVDCQKASFRPAPEKFSYIDCCGKKEEGEGFQPWEKRSPVSIDANQPYEGMDLTGENSNIDC